MKPIYFLLLLSLLPSCCPGGTVEYDLGQLPEEALRFVPYKAGESLKLKHSAGLVINYNINRQTTEEYTSCAECCDIYKYELNSTILSPDYPVFSFRFEISNFDSANYLCNAMIGFNSFFIPTSGHENEYFEYADSIRIDSSYYYNVFLLHSDDNNYYSSDSIYADSLYYNYANGILKITMSNEEYYEITY